jgi:LPXTG-motif cell wall-anchored protein
VKRIIVLLALTAAAVMVTAPAIAGAQETTPSDGAAATLENCSITSLTPNPATVQQGVATQITVGGTAQPNVHVALFVQGSSTAASQADTGSGGGFSLTATVTAPVTLTVSVTPLDGSSYPPAASCSDPYTGVPSEVAGIVVNRANAPTAAATAAQLAFTGSSNTPTYLLVGGAAVVLGLVLVIAARRRSNAGA